MANGRSIGAWRGWVDRRDRVSGGEFGAAGRFPATSVAVRLTSEIAGITALVSFASACGVGKPRIPSTGPRIGTAVASVSLELKSESIKRFPAIPTIVSEIAGISQRITTPIGRENLSRNPFSTRRVDDGTVKATRLRDASP
jgi:hypothetical protein